MCTQPNAYKRCAHTELAAANLPYTCVYIYIYIYIGLTCILYMYRYYVYIHMLCYVIVHELYYILSRDRGFGAATTGPPWRARGGRTWWPALV